MSMRRLRTRLLRLFLCVMVLTLTGFGLLGWLGAGHLVSPERRHLQDYHREILADPTRFGLSLQAFDGPHSTPCLLVRPQAGGEARKSRQLRSRLKNDGVPLGPWGEARGTIVLLHGHGGRKEDHLPICERFCAAGFRCLVLDLPGHGDHPDNRASFGFREADLVVEVLDDCATRFGFAPGPVSLFGVSQGGAIALRCAARHGERFNAVVSVASFAGLDEMIATAARRLHPGLRPVAPLSSRAVGLAAWLRGGFHPASIRPLDEARHIRIPALIVHGRIDRMIPPSDAQRIHEALREPRTPLRWVEDAGHQSVLGKDAANLYPDICRYLLTVHGS